MQDNRPSILVVEDDAQFRRYLAELLEDAGFHVRLVAGGKAALEALRKQLADVVLTDIVMPDQDGISLIRTLRQEWPDLHIIAMSGRSQTELGTDSLDMVRLLGADQTLHKPFSGEQLKRMLGRLLVRH